MTSVRSVVMASSDEAQASLAAALRGALASPRAEPSATLAAPGITITNGAPFPVVVSWCSPDGDLVPLTPLLAAYRSMPVNGAVLGSRFAVMSAPTGGLLGVVTVGEGATEYIVDDLSLTTPNRIGPPPEPSGDVLVPGDSPRVVVGSGWRHDGAILVREQYWRRGAQSVTLMPGERRTSAVTLTSGVEQSSTLEESEAQSYGASASAGWGPVSVGVSASLNLSTRSMQQVTITQAESTFHQIHLENTGSTVQTFLCWELVDCVTALDRKSLLPESTLTSVLTPPVVRGPYVPR